MRVDAGRVQLAPLLLADAAALFSLRSHPEVQRFQSWRPASEAVAAAFIVDNPAFGTVDAWSQLAMRGVDGALLGDIGVHLVDGGRQAEIGVTLHPDHQGNGLATDATRALLEALFERGLHRVFASVDPDNASAVALMERVGMTKEAHHRQSLWWRGRWVDDLVFARLASDGPNRA